MVKKKSDFYLSKKSDCIKITNSIPFLFNIKLEIHNHAKNCVNIYNRP